MTAPTKSFDRSVPPPDCAHPLYQLQAPVPEHGPGTVPRTVLNCAGCKQTWTGGHALAVMLQSQQNKMRDVEKLVLNNMKR